MRLSVEVPHLCNRPNLGNSNLSSTSRGVSLGVQSVADINRSLVTLGRVVVWSCALGAIRKSRRTASIAGGPHSIHILFSLSYSRTVIFTVPALRW